MPRHRGRILMPYDLAELGLMVGAKATKKFKSGQIDGGQHCPMVGMTKYYNNDNLPCN